MQTLDQHLKSFSNSIFAAIVAFTFAFAYNEFKTSQINPNIPPILLHQILLGLIAFIFVIDDWFGSRRILVKLGDEPDRPQKLSGTIFFLMDIWIAVLAYPLVMSAVSGLRIMGIFWILLFILGTIWALMASLDRHYSKTDHETKLQIATVIITHFIAACLLSFLCIREIIIQHWTIHDLMLPFSKHGGWTAVIGFSLFVCVHRFIAPKIVKIALSYVQKILTCVQKVLAWLGIKT